MAFQFKRDRSENIALTLTGDIDLEVTPDIKGQLAGQIEDARSLAIDARGVSYLDSSGVSIMVIAMQSCKQKRIEFTIEAISDEAIKVLQLAKLDKILPIKAITGPANTIDIDVFGSTGEGDSQLAEDVSQGGMSSDDDLIAAISSGDMGQDEPAAETPTVELEMTPEPAPEPSPQPTPQPAADPSPQPAPQQGSGPSDNSDSGASGNGDGGKFTPGTF